MELYDIYNWIYIGSLIACGVFFVIAVVLFFTLRISKVVSDLTGRTARKAIENIRMQNEQSGDKTYQSSAINLERGKLTDKISRSGRLVQKSATPFGTGVITEKISTMELEQPAGETDVLDAGEETSVLSNPAGETEVLMSPAGETTVLIAEEQPAQAFTVEYEITFIHTNEAIT